MDAPRLQRGQRLVIATHNSGKLREIAELLAPFGFDIASAAELGLAEPEETGTDFAANACLKARAAAQAAGAFALADDSGLTVDALGGAPGIKSARWAGPDRDFGAAMARVNDALEAAGAADPADRRAAFVAVLCLCAADGDCAAFEGRVEGTLVWPPRGEKGFGYDPIFLPDGHARTFGEMSAAEKHSWAPGKPGLSHRARAFAKFVEASCER